MASKNALIFDLDDTLVDTYGLLIIPMERRAAEMIAELDGVTLSPESILETLLTLHRKSPGELYSQLAKLAPERAPLVIQVHRQVFANFSVEALEIAASVTEMLKQLSRENKLVLLTEGEPKLQKAKIDHLGIEKLFSDILILDPQAGDSKFDAIQKFICDSQLSPESVFVIGNRIDKEIMAAKKLGAKAIWVRAGEGSEVEGGEQYADAILDHVGEVPDVLQRLS
jgi:putative hydrolase of the HAD superfamily